jgi:hypothetical protein
MILRDGESTFVKVLLYIKRQRTNTIKSPKIKTAKAENT